MRGPFDGVAGSYDDWFRTPVGSVVDRLELDLLFVMAQPEPGDRVLDVGTGTGHYAALLAQRGLAVTGVDISEPMLRIAAARQQRFGLVRADAGRLPFGDEAFDLVMCVTALEFVDDPLRVAAEMARVCRVGGRMVVGALNAWSPWAWARRRYARSHPGDPFAGAHFFRPGELAALLRRFGRVCWSSSVFFLPNGRGLRHADALERLGRAVWKSFGALLVGRVLR
jgi:ubiquinone/menaquinone biosynthesis C-methylase UbiE